MPAYTFPESSTSFGTGGGGASLTAEQRAVVSANRYYGRIDACRAFQPGTSLAALSPYARATNTLTSSALVAFPAVDGGAVGVGEYFIIWNEPNPLNNGLYQLTAAGAAGVSAWTAVRAAGFSGTDNVAGLIVAPYPWIGSANRLYCFVVTHDEAPVLVNTNPINLVRVERSRVMNARTDLNNTLNLITESGQRTTTESRDTFQVAGGGLVMGADTSFSIPGPGRLLSQPRSINFEFASGGLERVKQEEYCDLAGTVTSVDFTVPNGARLVAVLLAWDGNEAGPPTFNLGWTDAPTAFVTGAALGAAQSLIYSGAISRVGGPGTLQIQSGDGTPFAAGRVAVRALWETGDAGMIFL